MLNAKLMMLLGLSMGCAAVNDEQTGQSPAGEAVPASGVDAATSYALPAGARLIADVANNRFLVVTSDHQSAYALGKVVSCGCEGTCGPVALSRSIGCAAGAELRVSGYHYFPLDGSAAELSDARILAAPDLSVSALEPNTTRSCGIKADDFLPVMKRFAEDILAQNSNQKGRTLLLLEYRGAPAIAAAPRGLFPEYDRVNNYVIEIVPGDDAFTCTCNSGSDGCKKDSYFGNAFCNSGACMSCTFSS